MQRKDHATLRSTQKGRAMIVDRIHESSLRGIQAGHSMAVSPAMHPLLLFIFARLCNGSVLGGFAILPLGGLNHEAALCILTSAL
jgi:hypothetical protein